MIKFIILFFIVSCGKPITEEKTHISKRTTPLTGVSEEILLDTKMSLNFDLLPLSGKIKKQERLWSGDAWGLRRGAINYRWNSTEPRGLNLVNLRQREVLTLPTEKMKELSPAEKYDIYVGRYDFPLKFEVDWLAKSAKMDWEGLCHGWAGASLNHVEPGPVTVTNPDGIEVYFGSADVKALLTYAYSKILIAPEDSIGKRCELNGYLEEDLCNEDVSALAYHVVLANLLGLRGQSFIVDIDRYKEVWNHPVLSYESKIIKRINQTLTITTKMAYVDITEKNYWEKNKSRMVSYFSTTYELELDAQGNIIGSKWLTRERPDFIWTVKRPLVFEGYLSQIENLLK
jgi:hypothetical protein